MPMNKVKPVKAFSSVKTFRIINVLYAKKTEMRKAMKTRIICKGLKTKLCTNNSVNIRNVRNIELLITKFIMPPYVNILSFPDTSKSRMLFIFDSKNVLNELPIQKVRLSSFIKVSTRG